MKKIILSIAACVAAMTMNAQTTIWEDSFETYPDFEIANIGGWTQIDNDADTTWGIQEYNFTNEGYTGTGIVFNPSMAPADPDDGTFASDSPAWQVRTGDKGIFFFASQSPPNDDYLISPQIDLTGSTGSNLSFWAKSLTDAYGLEEFEILLSTTGTAESDFTVNLSGVVQPPMDVYTEYTYDLSAYDGQQIHIAIHYIGNDHLVLQMDDFVVQGNLGINDHQIAGFDYFYSLQENTLNLTANESFSNIDLFNIMGQKVMSQGLSQTEENINLSSLNAGVYLANVNVNGKTTTFKIVKR